MADVISGDSADSDVEENLGILRPTVLEQIKEILREYRNDVQIIKELIQNADDAGASQMKILYQAKCLNPEHAAEKKFRKFLRAPALVFYNDSVFTEENWKGVRSIYTSEKAHDPLQIGRFGLGFKSIFHMTDFPTILSGKKIMFIDPGEQDPDKICTSIRLDRIKRSKNLRLSDLLLGFDDLFGFNEAFLDNGYFPGTLFWFPLRQESSDLSDTIYTDAKVINLLDTFIEESDRNILFANTVSKIEVFIERSKEEHTIDSNNIAYDTDSRLHLQKANFGKDVAVYSVQIENASDTLIQERRELRKTLISLLKEVPEISEKWAFDVYVKCAKRLTKEEIKESRSRWLIVNYLKGGELSKHTQQLLKDKHLGYHHLVGVAGQIKETDVHVIHSDSGCVFCNQPLPQENQTGLPVFINAQFALGNNRRQIKWEDKECLGINTDKEIEWNHALVSEILPYAYLALLQEMINLSKAHANPTQLVESAYKLIPDFQKTDERWKKLGEKFLYLAENENIYYAGYHGGQWIDRMEVILLSDCEMFSETIAELLTNEEIPFAIIPKNVNDALSLSTSKIKKMSPEFLSQHMAKNTTYKNMSSLQKEHLLQYLKSNETEDTDIEELELIPLADSSFTCLKGTDEIFFEPSEEVVKVFPGRLSKFVSTNLLSETLAIIQTIADGGSSRLKTLNAERSASMIKDVLEENFGPGKLFTLYASEVPFWKQWILNVWELIQDRYKESLDKLASLPIYPFECEPDWQNPEQIKVCCLSSLVMYFPNCDDGRVAETVSQAFELLSVNIVRNLPDFISTALTDTYITNDQSWKMVNLFERITSKEILHFNANVNCEKQFALLRYVSQTIHTEISPLCINVLKGMRLFRQSRYPFENEYCCVSMDENKSIIGVEDFPVKLHKPMVFISMDSEILLAKKLGGTVLDKEALTLQTLSNISNYTPYEVQCLVEWIFKDSKLMNNDNVTGLLKETKFIKSTDGQWREPSHFFDPYDQLISKLFKNEGVLPEMSGINDKFILQSLKHLGMKSMIDISQSDIVRTCGIIDANASKNERDDFEKAEALLEFLNLPSTVVDKTLFCDKKFVPVHNVNPDNYPSSMKMKSRGCLNILCMPSEVKSLEYINLIGSVLFVIDCSKLRKFSDNHGLSKPPEVRDVILHLKNVLTDYRIQSKTDYVQMISKIYEWFAGHTKLREMKFSPLLDSFKKPYNKFIWNGTGFVSPDDLYLDSSEENLEDLNSVMSKLPAELQHFGNFFLALGCRQSPNLDMFLKALKIIKDRSEDKDETESKSSLRKMAITILNKLKDYNVTNVKETDIYFPVHEQASCDSLMKPVNECVYCENYEHKQFSMSDDAVLIHSDVPIATAKALGVPNVRRKMLSESEFFESWGQEEALAIRIRNIIKHGYEDGFTVIKELFQNAEDAGASCFYIMYDERGNRDAHESLISEAMSECQGPAFWVFNDAEFSEQDFENIRKLGIGTKQDQPGKIGKYGHGFCAVYNLTDVPSILSGSNLILFDPQTTYLDKALPQGVPGVRIDLRRQDKMDVIHAFSDQFKPYENVFGCNLLSDENRTFHGTLIRLPLRTKISQISDNIYTKSAATRLMCSIMELSDSLLLFNDSIHEIRLFHLTENESNPSNANLVFEANAKKQDIPDMADIEQRLSIAKDKCRRRTSQVLQGESFNLLQEVCITTKKSDEHKWEDNTTKWIISWTSETNEVLEQMIEENPSVLPLGSIAIPVEIDEHRMFGYHGMTITLCPLENLPFCFYKVGHYFCSLPTQQIHTFMFHINGKFQLTLDRKNVKMKTDEIEESKDAQWNELLISYPIASALLHFLENTKTNQHDAFKIWPKKHDEMDVLSKCLVETFYTNISKETERSVFEHNGEKVCLSQCLFLDPDLRAKEEVGNIAFKYLLQNSDKCVIDIPGDIYSLLNKFNTNLVKQITVYTEDFLLDFFLPYLDLLEMTLSERNFVLTFAIDQDLESVKMWLSKNDCIPADNGRLKKPHQLVYPKSKHARLFPQGEGFFPEPSFADKENIFELLIKLGMQTDELSEETILNRAHSIINDQTDCSECIIDRALYLMAYLCENINTCSAISLNLKEMHFLPLMSKPEEWPFSWQSSNADMTKTKCRYFEGTACKIHNETKPCLLLGSPSMMYTSEFCDLVSIHHLIVDKHFCDRLKKQERLSSMECDNCFYTLGMHGTTENKRQEVKEVVRQLQDMTDFYQKECKPKDKSDMIENVLRNVYNFLEDFSNAADLECLKDRPVIWVKDTFVIPKKVSRDNTLEGCQPYLYNVQDSAISRCPNLYTSLDVVEHFYANDVAKVLEGIANGNGNVPCNEIQVKICVNLLFLLENCFHKEKIESIETFLGQEGNAGSIYIPDEYGVLRKYTALCLNDAEDIEKTSNMIYIHEHIPIALAKSFEVKGKGVQRLEESCEDIENFYQEEPLYIRLRQLLYGFSTDAGIFKELLQNADDATASEVIFIKDFTKYPIENVFDKNFNELQGPSLCVFNDRPFTSEDLHGIKQLGLGSKSNDPSKIGQFGIGFNSVYNLTDAPSFYTVGTNIERGETMCIFDPLASFIPNVSKDKPGKRFKDLSWLREKHPDVLKGYHEDLFKSRKEGGTMFRFPLRTQPSDIKSDVVDLFSLSKTLDEFCNDLSQFLIFLRHVKTVRVWSYENGEYKEDYIIEAVLSPDDLNKRNHWVSVLNSLHIAFDNHRSDILDVAQETVEYNISFRETMQDKCIKSSYGVIQTVGFDPVLGIPKLLQEEYKKGNITLLPEGGIAFNRNSNIKNCQGKLSCLLPLPITTGLPAHVNGNFVLDYGTRRSLFKSLDEDKCYKTQWNIAILEHIVAKSYVTYLQNLHSSICENNFSEVSVSDNNIKHSLDYFYSHFPSYADANDSYWKFLTQKIYSCICTRHLPFLPVLEQDCDQSSSKLSWIPISLNDCNKTDIYDLCADETSTKYCEQQLVTILRRTGMKIADIPMNIKDSFEKSGIIFKSVSPESVVDYICSCDEEEHVLSGQPIKETCFESCNDLKEVFSYCLQEKRHFFAMSTSMPIFLTQDGILRKLSESNKLFVTEFIDFFPERLHQFTHKILYDDLQAISYNENEKLKGFADISKGNLLHFEIKDFANFAATDGLLWNHEQISNTGHDHIPPFEMVQQFWLLFIDQLHDEQLETVKKNLEEIMHLRLLPVIDPVSRQRDLITVAESNTLIDLDSFQGLAKLHGTLQMFSIRELDKNFFEIDCKGNKSKSLHSVANHSRDKCKYLSKMYMLLCEQVPNFNDPGKIIHCLVNNLSNINWAKVDADQAATLLNYFSDRVENLRYKEISTLKSIPVFETPSKKLTSIDTCYKVVVKPDEIPVSGLYIISKTSNVILLRDFNKVSDLFRLLDISYLSTEIIYLEIIFPHQSCLSRDQFFEHIDYLCKHVIGPNDKVENNMILKGLFDLSFIEVGLSGFVRVMDTFYDDPKWQKVFKLFCKKHEILPEVYQTPHIIEVFKNKLGLQCDMTIELFERFASEIANTHCHYGTNAKEKAALLVKILFRKGEKFRHINDFTRLSTIPFIFPTPLDHLSTIYKQFNSQRAFCFANSVLFEKQNTCWTSANILPKWADPRSYNAHELLRKLCIRMKPNEDQLFAHCKHIGNALKDGLSCFKDDRDEITEVMECVYEALSESSAHIRNFNDLKTIPMIYFPIRKITKLAVSVITECSTDEEIEPYLQKMPKEYGKFESLFLKLGASKEPSVLQYVDVIETIRRESSMNVTQEQKDAILKAMSNIFKFLKKLTSPTLGIHSLYMLSDTYMLTEAKKLVICNNRYLQKRLQKGMNMTYMANIEQPGIDSIVDSLQMLPDYYRPLLLTDTVKEEVDIGSVSYKKSDIANKFENFIHNQLFVTSVCRLARHGIRNKLSGEWNDTIEKDITELVLNIELKHVENICTHLFLNEKMIEKTSETKSVYTHVMGKKTIVYFDTGNAKWYSDVSNEIILRLKGCHACLEDKLLFTAQKIFMCNDPDLCEEILDKEGIEAYNGLNGPTAECKNAKAEIERQPYQLYPEAKQWQRQAHCDLDNARECLSVLRSDAYNWICYKTHQASEKSLKAAWYATDANKLEEFGESHCLVTISRGLSTELAKHTDELTDITGWHTRMRYPKPSSKIPSELYSRKNAEDAVRIAGNILQEVDALLLHLKQ